MARGGVKFAKMQADIATAVADAQRYQSPGALIDAMTKYAGYITPAELAALQQVLSAVTPQFTDTTSIPQTTIQPGASEIFPLVSIETPVLDEEGDPTGETETRFRTIRVDVVGKSMADVLAEIETVIAAWKRQSPTVGETVTVDVLWRVR